MDPSLRRFIEEENAKAARSYYDKHDLIVVFSAVQTQKSVSAVDAALDREVRELQLKFSAELPHIGIKFNEMLERQVPGDVVSPELGLYWYIALTYSDEGRSRREVITGAFRERLKALQASGLALTELSNKTTEYKVSALLFGHPVE